MTLDNGVWEYLMELSVDRFCSSEIGAMVEILVGYVRCLSFILVDGIWRSFSLSSLNEVVGRAFGDGSFPAGISDAGCCRTCSVSVGSRFYFDITELPSGGLSSAA